MSRLQLQLLQLPPSKKKHFQPTSIHISYNAIQSTQMETIPISTFQIPESRYEEGKDKSTVFFTI
jgi:hypothetical protein